MATDRVEVITRAERRRRWSPADKLRLVMATREPAPRWRRWRASTGYRRACSMRGAAGCPEPDSRFPRDHGSRRVRVPRQLKTEFSALPRLKCSFAVSCCLI